MPASPPLSPAVARRPLGWVVAALVLVVALTIAVGALGARPAVAATKEVSIGVADKSLPYWKTYVALAKSKLGVTVRLVNFSDYSLPNPALEQGQVDINQFQHIQYLANYNVTAGDDLQPIGATAIYPLPLYSTSVTKVSKLRRGDEVAIPNDAINEARALLVLQSAKLLKLKGGGNAFSTTSDITSHKVDVRPVDASQTANALQQGSVRAAIVNVNYATSAGLAKKDAIFQDDPSSKSAAPYVNIFATTAAQKKNATYLKLAKLFQDKAVQKVFARDYPDAVSKKTSAATLQKELAAVEKDAENAAR
ncbi:MetQ/NlpA family ABC transporter substrate-binding protein [Curtobacterium sp. RRHDQ10]|uniref:MetQ/NlpA family ABC transporter substrate-binding protein n=1 Tax=Curtobacterium phyllosphaerae TaxID=3413379 RepID=UPI003BF2D215